MRLAATIISACLIASAIAADELPQRAEQDGPMDFEPGVLPNLNEVREPTGSVTAIEAALDRAKRSAASGERLFRAGIIAKVEAEKRVLKVVRLGADLAAARLDATKIELSAKRAEFAAGKLSEEQLDAVQAAADAASESAESTRAAWRRAEIEAAEINVSRQRKLLAAGIGSKALLQRAVSQVAALKSKPAQVSSPEAK